MAVASKASPVCGHGQQVMSVDGSGNVTLTSAVLSTVVRVRAEELRASFMPQQPWRQREEDAKEPVPIREQRSIWKSMVDLAAGDFTRLIVVVLEMVELRLRANEKTLDGMMF